MSASDVNGNDVDVTELIEGVVDQMSFDDGSALPTIDGVPIELASIVRLTNGDEP